MLFLLPETRTATRLPLTFSQVAGPVTSPCWPCTILSPLGKVLLAGEEHLFSPTL
jgi:hypothetical protein